MSHRFLIYGTVEFLRFLEKTSYDCPSSTLLSKIRPILYRVQADDSKTGFIDYTTWNPLTFMNFAEYFIYAALWLSFGILHSILAGTSAKHRLKPVFGSTYRLCYNLFSALHIGLILLAGHLWLGNNSASFDFSDEFVLIVTFCKWLGIAIMAAALTQYDLGRFGGLTQIRLNDRKTSDDEPLHITGMHRYVRHPIYLGAYFYLWGDITHELGLQTALWGSLYLFVGTWFEEHKLIKLYGQAYTEYRQKVPSIFPFRGRAI